LFTALKSDPLASSKPVDEKRIQEAINQMKQLEISMAGEIKPFD
jgi:hypothetical protein